MSLPRSVTFATVPRAWTRLMRLKRGTVKVDAARKRGGIKIVWLAWFTDCIALWERQDETAYLLDDAPVAGAAAATTISGPGGTNSDPLKVPLSAEEAADDVTWDDSPAGEKGAGALALDAINWDDINDEVDAAMNESDDDEDGMEDARSVRSAMSEDEWSDDASRCVATLM